MDKPDIKGKGTDIVFINGYNLSIRELYGCRVVTFRDIDELHGRPEGTAKRNFAENRAKFGEGIDYFLIPRTELGTDFVPNSSRGNPDLLTMLITESGYLMLVKSFTDDLAWNVQRQLVNGYFRAKQAAIQHRLPQNYVEALRELADTVEQKILLEAKIETDKPKVQFAERVKDATGRHDMKETAKILGWGPNLLFAHLRDMHVFMSGNTPLQKFIDRGYFVVHENLISISGQDIVKPQTFVTPKGLIWLQRVIPPPEKRGFPGHRPGGGKAPKGLGHEYGGRAEALGGLK